MRRLIIGMAAGGLMLAPAAAEDFKIGFLSTRTGGGAVIGKQLENGFMLGLEHRGWRKDGDKLGGVPTTVIIADDQLKPDVGLKEVDKLLKQDKVHVVAGVIWANVFTAIAGPVFDSKRLLIGAVSGLAQYAGAQCNPLFVSTSFQNDQNAEATGELMTKREVKSVVGMAPNYQAGREYLDAFERTYKNGKVLERIMYKLGEADFQAEFAKLRALKPEAVLIFAPGAMGISFMKQWQASGLAKDIKLYSLYTIDNANLAAIGEAALGVVDTNHWSPDIANPANQRFVKDYVAKFNASPSFFSVGGYDVAAALENGVKATGGKLDDMAAVARGIRKSALPSPRGDLKFNVNGFLLQPYYAREFVKGADGKPTIKMLGIVTDKPDSYWDKCPAERRI